MPTAEVIDTTLPAGKWAFDADVTAAFDDMLRRSILQYEVMRSAVFDTACRFVKPKTDILDLGCSRGEALAPFVEKFGAFNRYVGVDVSAPMLAAARERFAGLISSGIVEIRECDLRAKFPPVRASAILSVLTLQFTPIEYRQRIIRDVYRHLIPGGAFLLVEKVLGADADIDRVMTDQYLGLKAEHGYTPEQIERKRLSLEGVLVPVTAAWNEDLIRQAGFVHADCIWRWMNFAAWVAIKAGEG